MRKLAFLAVTTALVALFFACDKHDDILVKQQGKATILTSDSLFAGLSVTNVEFGSANHALITFKDKTTMLAHHIADEAWAFKYGGVWRGTIGVGLKIYDVKSTDLNNFSDTSYVNKQTLFFNGVDSVYTYNYLDSASKPFYHMVFQRNMNLLQGHGYSNPNPIIVGAATCCTAGTQRAAMNCAFALATEYCGTDDWSMEENGTGGGPTGDGYNYSLNFHCKE